MITVALTLSGGEIFLRLDKFETALHDVLRKKFSILINELRAKVEENLSGELLQVKSGALLRSVRSGVDEQGTALIGFVEIDPPNETVKTYALAHEYGGKASYYIRVGEKGVLANRETGFFSKRDVIHPPAQEKRYLRGPFSEMRSQIIQGLQDAIDEVLAE